MCIIFGAINSAGAAQHGWKYGCSLWPDTAAAKINGSFVYNRADAHAFDGSKKLDFLMNEHVTAT